MGKDSLPNRFWLWVCEGMEYRIHNLEQNYTLGVFRTFWLGNVKSEGLHFALAFNLFIFKCGTYTCLYAFSLDFNTTKNSWLFPVLLQ